MALDAWLDESPAHDVAFWRLEGGLSQAERFAALKHLLTATRTPRNRRILPLMFGAVASLAVFVGLLFGIPFIQQNNLHTYATAVGGHRTLSFADGSKIELNTDTVVRLASGARPLSLYLDKGEVFFQIKHNADRPFVIHAGDHRIVDLGTKFIIRRDEQQLQLAVMEGRVQLDAENNSAKPRTLTAGDVVVATAKGVTSERKPLTALSDELGWQRGELVFDHVTLAYAVSEFNRYNSRKLLVADTHVARLTIDGKFRTNNIDLFARVTRDVLKLRIETIGNETVLSR
ncbi:MAG TPA: FecR domain-containing protein [Rhizomicrobium sp.]